MAQQFPILKLDNEALKCVLRRLNLDEIIAFASLSKKAFNLINLLKVNISFLNVTHIFLRGSVPVPSLIVNDVYIDKCQFGSSANQKLLLQNNDRASLVQPRVRNFYDLLVSNAKEIYCYTDGIQERDLNKFLKAWKKGSNPRLEELDVDVPFTFGLEGMMKGIHFNEIPEEKVKKYDCYARRVCKMRSAKGVIAEIRVLQDDEEEWCTVNVFFGRDFVY